MQISDLQLLGKYAIAAGVIVAAAVLSQRYLELERDKVEAQVRQDQGILLTARCADNFFQEVQVAFPDGGGYKCGAIRELPVDKEELARWYQKEVQSWLNAKGGPKKR